ncbi:MAG: hypothetical protein ACREDL_16910 [Bradyrhizobium sp.]
MSSLLIRSQQGAPVLAMRFLSGEIAEALSENTRKIAGQIAALEIPDSPASSIEVLASEEDFQGRVFDALAGAKILTSQVAMHIERPWRDWLFGQLDSLHDISEWEEGDRPVVRSSFATFLKAVLDLPVQVRPGLGLSHDGNIIAAWTAGRNRLTIEFLPHDFVRWTLTRYVDGDAYRFAGHLPVSGLAESLSSHQPERWFSYEGRQRHEPPG